MPCQVGGGRRDDRVILSKRESPGDLHAAGEHFIDDSPLGVDDNSAIDMPCDLAAIVKFSDPFLGPGVKRDMADLGGLAETEGFEIQVVRVDVDQWDLSCDVGRADKNINCFGHTKLGPPLSERPLGSM